jgi:hypothetical protein
MKTGDRKRKRQGMAKASTALKDLEPRKSPSGGRAGTDKKYMEIKLKEVFISAV